LLSGLLYFHRISDNRMAGTPLKNLRMFEELCGKNAFKNVILTTTMWDEVDEETGATREEELKGIYWKAMIDRHSSTGRFVGTRDSALRLIAPFLDEANTRNRLLLQKELVDLDLRLSETHAGQKLRSEIKQLAKQQQELLHQIREELKRPNNATSLQSLMEEYEELKKTSGSLLAQMADLQVPLGRQLMNTITITFGIKRNRFVYNILICASLIGIFKLVLSGIIHGNASDLAFQLDRSWDPSWSPSWDQVGLP